MNEYFALEDHNELTVAANECWQPNLEFPETDIQCIEILVDPFESRNWRFSADITKPWVLIQAKTEARGYEGRGLRKVIAYPRSIRAVLVAPRAKAKVQRRPINLVAPAAPQKLEFSIATLDLVQEGFRLYATGTVEGLCQQTSAKREISSDELSNFIREQFYLMIGGIVDILAQHQKNELQLAYRGNFTDAVDVLLRSRLPNVPRKFSDLSASLCQDLNKHLLNGGSVEGSWGRVFLHDGALILAANGRRIVPPVPVGRARVVE